MKEQTLIIIKPDGVRKKLVGKCLSRFERIGFDIVYLKVARLNHNFINTFYSHLIGKIDKKVFNSISKYLRSGSVIFAILEGKNVVRKVRKICGPTNPTEAPIGTIRGDYAVDDLKWQTKYNKETQNIIHSSGNKSEARSEIALIKKLFS